MRSREIEVSKTTENLGVIKPGAVDIDRDFSLVELRQVEHRNRGASGATEYLAVVFVDDARTSFRSWNTTENAVVYALPAEAMAVGEFLRESSSGGHLLVLHFRSALAVAAASSSSRFMCSENRSQRRRRRR